MSHKYIYCWYKDYTLLSSHFCSCFLVLKKTLQEFLGGYLPNLLVKMPSQICHRILDERSLWLFTQEWTPSFASLLLLALTFSSSWFEIKKSELWVFCAQGKSKHCDITWCFHICRVGKPTQMKRDWHLMLPKFLSFAFLLPK